ncbi:hypothetical protein [Okeania sp. SIO3B5]|nr:hypothetical protein [Okeania sp. SIO3B5]
MSLLMLAIACAQRYSEKRSLRILFSIKSDRLIFKQTELLKAC